MKKWQIIEYGLKVFNFEDEKFYRWLSKNGELSNEELKNKLDKIEYGNFC